MKQNIQSQPVITFRCFSRKSYALFNCLGREVRIGVLSVATLLCATPAIHAQFIEQQTPPTPEKDETLLDEATVSASRAPFGAEVVARQVTVLNRTDLAAAGVSTLNDALKLSASVDVRQRGGFGIQTDISINGGTFDQIALYVNGIPFSNPQTGHNAADFPFTLEDVERIEVLEGAIARLFGAQAFSGAINIVTRSNGRSMVQLQGGSYGTAMVDARGAFHIGKATTSLSSRFFRSDGATENSDFKGGSLFWQGQHHSSDLHLSWQLGATLKDFGANTFYSAAYNNQWEATRRYLGAIQAEIGTKVHFTPKISWVRSTDHYLLNRAKPTAYENFNRTDVVTIGVGAWTNWKFGRTAIGAEMQNEHLLSRNLGFDLDKNLWTKIPSQDSLYYTRGANRTNLSFYAEHNVFLRCWTFSLGAFAQKNTLTDKHFHLLGGADISYRPNANWSFFASWNQAMRQPTFTDLWYKSPTHEGNGSLKAERNSAFRIGANFQTKALTISAKAFYQHGSNMIDWVQREANGKWQSANFAIDNYGISLRTELSLKSLLGLNQPFERFTMDYAYIDQDRKDDVQVYKANYALEYLRHKLTATLSHRLFADLHAAWNFRLQHREGHYEVYENGKSTGTLLPYGTYAQLDCRLSWERPRYTLSLDLTNLTSHRYYDYGNVRQAGFLLMAGAIYRF